MDQKRMILKYGPYGSQLPENYSFKLKLGQTIKEVIVRHGFIVDAIGFVVAKLWRGTYTEMFGGTGGNESKIVLDCGEKITQISGTYGNYIYQGGQCLIGTMKIHTNLCPNGYGPFGQGKGIECSAKDFSSPCIVDGSIVGVFGRNHNYLESVGIFVEKIVRRNYILSPATVANDSNMRLGIAHTRKKDDEEELGYLNIPDCAAGFLCF